MSDEEIARECANALLVNLAITPNQRQCAQCNNSLICPTCGQFFQWSPMIDNVVQPWYFCSEKCKREFAKGLKVEK